MLELEAAIREHLELKRRREPTIPEPVVEADRAWPGPRGAMRPVAEVTSHRPAAKAVDREAGSADGALPEARAVAGGATRAPQAKRVPRSVRDVDPGLLGAEELAARRASARERTRRVRRLRRAVTWAGLAGIGLILVPVLLAARSALTGASRQGVSQHRSRRVPPTYPFAASPTQRRAGPADQLEPFWADGQSCSVGCRAPGVVSGWPLKPFHAQHALRAGLNEQRKTSFHHGIDIQAYDNSPVYAIQPGRAQILQATGADSRVLVGNFIYWHIHPLVREGQRIEPYRQIVGTITRGHGHLHLSELDSAKRYINPLRPGGRALEPYSDSAPPVIDRPRLSADGHVIVRAFDPQSFQVTTTYKTPVIAPAALAYRIFDQAGQRLGPLHWAMRGSQNLEWTSDTDAAIYATGSRPELGNCFERKAVCQPNYIYVIAGGLAPPLTQLFLPTGGYRVTVYAWDWAGNTTGRDAYFTIRADGSVAG